MCLDPLVLGLASDRGFQAGMVGGSLQEVTTL